MAPLKTLEDRLSQCQRDADARIRAEVEEAVTRVRKVEMSKMRLEEQAKYSQQLAQVSVAAHARDPLPLLPSAVNLCSLDSILHHVITGARRNGRHMAETARRCAEA